jgi:hypothetical protein
VSALRNLIENSKRLAGLIEQLGLSDDSLRRFGEAAEKGRAWLDLHGDCVTAAREALERQERRHRREIGRLRKLAGLPPLKRARARRLTKEAK